MDDVEKLLLNLDNEIDSYLESITLCPSKIDD